MASFIYYPGDDLDFVTRVQQGGHKQELHQFCISPSERTAKVFIARLNQATALPVDEKVRRF